MNLEGIAATLMMLGIGVATACDAEKKPATEVEGAKAPAGEADRKGEMSCAEGKCAAGACGGKKHDGDEAAHAEAEAKGDANAKAPAVDAKAPSEADAKAPGGANANAPGEAKPDRAGEASCGEGSCGAAHGGQKVKDKS